MGILGRSVVISIITPTYNGAPWIKKCLSSFYSFAPIDDFEWIIFDSGGDETENVIRSFNDDRLKYFKLSTNNDSFSKINNMGVNFSRGDHILFLNNDVEFCDSSSINNMMKLLDKYSAGCVGARLLYPSGGIQHCGVIYRHNRLPWNMRDGVTEEFLKYDRKYQAVTAACMLCRKSDILDVGGFDERYYFCFEDVDLCLKIRKVVGKDSIYCAGTKFIHHESRTILMLNNTKQKFLEAAKLLRVKWDRFVDVDEYKYKDVKYNVV
jgi:GT2 family glycosyltransferase